MATVTSVYSVDPNVRTAEDITAALFRDEPDENADKQPRPKPQNKNTTAYFPERAENAAGGEVAISGIHVDEQARRSFTRERLLKSFTVRWPVRFMVAILTGALSCQTLSHRRQQCLDAWGPEAEGDLIRGGQKNLVHHTKYLDSDYCDSPMYSGQPT
ncbi:MAG TPA: hypothetical protein PLR25_15850 [Planctomycetaceae bacterium]|nr:hypothetical protein [Planctomycetaceae bacterium]